MQWAETDISEFLYNDEELCRAKEMFLSRYEDLG